MKKSQLRKIIRESIKEMARSDERNPLNEKWKWWKYSKCGCESTMMMPDETQVTYKACCGGSGAPCSSRWDCPKHKGGSNVGSLDQEMDVAKTLQANCQPPASCTNWNMILCHCMDNKAEKPTQSLNEKPEMCKCKETINGKVTKFLCKRKGSTGSGCGCCRRFKNWMEGPYGPDMVNQSGGGEKIAEGGRCSGGQILEADLVKKDTCATKGTTGCKGSCDGSCNHNHWVGVGEASDEYIWCDCKGGGNMTPTNDDEFLRKI